MKPIKLILYILAFYINIIINAYAQDALIGLQNFEKLKLAINRSPSSSITTFAIHPKSNFAISGGRDNTITLWDINSGREMQKFLGHTGEIYSLAFHPIQDWIISASADSDIILWDMKTGKKIRKFENGHKFDTGFKLPVSSIAISHDGRFVLSGGWDSRMLLWDISTAAILKEYKGGEGWLNTVIFSSDGKKLLSASLQEWRLWDKETTNSLVHVKHPKFNFGIKGMIARSYSAPVLFDRTGKHVIAGTWDGSLSMWDTATGDKTKSFPISKGEISAIAISKDGKLIASTGEDRILHIWNIDKSTEVKKINAHDNWATGVAFSTDSNTIITSGMDKLIRRWDLKTEKEILQFGTEFTQTEKLNFSLDGSSLIAFVKNPSTPKLEKNAILNHWDLFTGKTPSVVHSFKSYNDLYSISDDGKLALVGKNTEKYKSIISTDTGDEIYKFEKFSENYSAVKISPKSKIIISNNTHQKHSVYTIANDKKLTLFSEISTADKSNIFFSSDEKYVALISSNSIIIKNLLNNTDVTINSPNNNIKYITFSHDNKKFISLNHKNEISILNLNGKILANWQTNHSGEIYVLTIDQNSKYLMTAGSDLSIRLWDIDTGKEISVMTGHTDIVKSLAFHPNGKFVASSGDDKSIKLWLIPSGKEIATLYSKPNDGWIVTDSEGRFDTSDLEDSQELHWIISSDFSNPVPVESFMKDYYEPRLLSRILSGENLKPVRPITTIKLTQPKVEITNIKFAGAESSLARVTVRVTATNRQLLNQGKQITEQIDAHDLRLFRDGQLVGYVDGLVARHGGKPFERTFTIRLAKSNSEYSPIFSAYAFNDDRVKSATVKSTFKSSPIVGKTSVQKGTVYLITMGVNKHENTDWNLKFAANDAKVLNERVTASLQKTQKYDSVVNINLISNDNENNATKMAMQAVLNRLSGKMENASSKNLLSKIINANLLKPANPDDTIIISFSGHGYASSNGNFYMITQNTGFEKGKILTVELNNLSISSEDISNWIRDIDAGDISMIIDACQSETSIQKEGFKPGPMGNKGLGQLSFDKGMRILAASQNDQAALENNKIQHGLLSYSMVIEGLKNFEADYDAKDGQITMDEWFRYGLVRVPKLTDEIRTGTFQGKGSEWRFKGFTEESVTASGATVVKNITNIVQQPALFDFGKSLRVKKILASKNTSQ